MVLQDEGILQGLPLMIADFDEKIERARITHTKWPLPSLSCLLTLLKPSFLNRSPTPKKSPSPTAWLDGLRGTAAFLVFIYHFQHLFHTSYNIGYASNDGQNDHFLMQLPILRLLVTGGPMVSIFWVLSGTSLSLKPIRLARARQWTAFQETMCSSVFRRALRLYLPCLAVQTGVLVATLLGLYDHAFELADAWPFSGTNEQQHRKQPTALAQVADWAAEMWHAADPFRPGRPGYDPHLWTIALEMRNSMVLFVVLVGLGRVRERVRLGVVAALYAYLVLVDQGDVGLFIAGMGCAEVLLLREEAGAELDRLGVERRREDGVGGQRKRTKVLWTAVCVLGLHMLSIPAWNHETTPGYEILHALCPSHLPAELTIQRLGAAIFLFALCNSPYLRHAFSHGVALYLGRISFPLYIVHGPLTHILGYRLVPFFWNLVGSRSDDPELLRYEVGVVAAFVLLAAVVVWVADLVARGIDAPFVEFGRWLEGRWSV